MEELITFLNYPTITLAGQTITIFQWIIVPSILLSGYFTTKWVVRKVTNSLTKKNVDPDIVHFVRRLFYIIAIVILVLTALDLVNVPLTAFAFVSGAVAIGLGFGAQNIINNFISGWILMWERPIRIGDFLEIEQERGTVEAINTRSTRIRRIDGVHMLIPNSKLLENTVTNWTLVDRMIRTSVRVGVAYGSSAEQVKSLILEAAAEQIEVLKQPEPLVIFEDFGDNALIFELFIWVYASVDKDLRIIRSDIRFRIESLFTAHNIVIAFPQRDVHIKGALLLQKSPSNHAIIDSSALS